MIPIFKLPSEPEREIFFDEQKYSDMIDLAEVAKSQEEKLTTIFLNKWQTDKEKFYDSRRWTGEDRRTALFWIYIHFTKNWDYECKYQCNCEKEHKDKINLYELGLSYKTINGLPERDIEIDGQQIIVHPLRGDALEELEYMRIPLADADMARKELSDTLDRIEKLHGFSDAYWKQFKKIREFDNRIGRESGEYNKVLTQIRGLEVMFAIELKNKNGILKNRREKERYIESLSITKFNQLRDMVFEALSGMQHGLQTVLIDGKIYILSNPIQCPDGKEVYPLRLRIPFRNHNTIWGIQQTRIYDDPEQSGGTGETTD